MLLDRGEAPYLERLWRRCGAALHQGRPVHHDDALLGDAELRYLGAVLLRSGAQSVAAVARAATSCRSAHRRFGLPERSIADAAQVGRTLLQSQALDANAFRRPFCTDGRAATPGRGYSSVLPLAALVTAAVQY